jgi:hypothetical protein
MTTACILCGQTLTPRQAERFAGMDLCTPCFEAANPGAWQARGFVFAERHWTQGAEQPSRWTEVRGTGRRPSSLSVSFETETGGIRAGKFLGMKRYRRELQTGDETFDRLVFIETDEPAAVAPLLRDERLRDALTEILLLVSRVEFEPPGVRIPYCHNWSRPPAHHEVVRSVALLLHLLECSGTSPG